MHYDTPATPGKATPCNLSRMTDALSRGLHLPVAVDGTRAIGFVVRLDDAPFGPVAVVHLPDGHFIRILYRDPEELSIISPEDTLRIS